MREHNDVAQWKQRQVQAFRLGIVFKDVGNVDHIRFTSLEKIGFGVPGTVGLALWSQTMSAGANHLV